MITKDTLITAAWLRSKEARENQVKLFESYFPNGIKITKRLCIKHGGEFDINWLALNVLSISGLDEYRAKRDSSYAEYDAKLRPIWHEYLANCKLVHVEYQAKRMLIWDEYDAKLSLIYAEYQAKCALAFWSIFSKQGKDE